MNLTRLYEVRQEDPGELGLIKNLFVEDRALTMRRKRAGIWKVEKTS